MNFSDFVVPEYTILITLFVISVFAMVAGLIAAAIAFLSSTPKVFRAVGCAFVAVAVVSTGITSVMLADAKDRQDANFTRALSDAYGATSSTAYSKMMDNRDFEAEVTRDGKSTLVRFVSKGDKLTPIVLSDGEYPALGEK
ncbi:hypothetical protein [Arthrobacter sp. UYCo732]|uniref:hypothetical protein n=1 Tax=Arthrobacter sp. UYCo732 TaxID=3156336 RepID=UPI00339B2A16